MEARFFRIAYKYGYCENILKRFKKRTTLNLHQIYLILDFFIFFLRKFAIEKEYIKIILFGTFYIKCMKKRILPPRFNPSENLRAFINNVIEFKGLNGIGMQSPKPIYKEISEYAKKFLMIKQRNCIFLFDLFIEGIIQELLEKQQIKVRNIGVFYIEEYKSSTTYLFGKYGNYKRKKIIKFIPLQSFIKEAGRINNEYKITDELKKVFNYYNFSIEVKKDDKEKRRIVNGFRTVDQGQ